MDKDYILTMASDLESLAELLNNEGINTSKLYIVSGNLKQNKILKYDIEPFKIEIDNNEKFPKKLSHQKSAIDLVLYFDMKINCNSENFASNKDPFSEFSFNIVIKGKNKNKISSKLLYAIHFDKHNVVQTSNQSHPNYHFQFGGNRLKEDENNRLTDLDFGQALFLDAPRVMHHPMELILSIDFILSNFFPTIWNKIKLLPIYKKILRKYQKDFILPYFKSIVQHFEDTKNEWNAQEIYPQLIGR
jgi:hypothetical protein